MIDPLNHAELIVPSRAYAPILGPREIPIHPKVFASLFPYSQAFVGEVKRALLQHVREDATQIARILGIEVKVDGSFVRWKNDLIGLDDHMLAFVADPEKRSVDMLCGETNMAIDVSRRREYHERTLTHPLPPKKQEAYSIQCEGNQHLVWYDHNMSHASLPLQLLFRNFAIAFNNLALKEL